MAGESSGSFRGICKKISDEKGNTVKLHCIIHYQVFCSKYLPINRVMKVMVIAINFIRSKSLFHRAFQQFLHDIDTEYGDVLYHNDVRWLAGDQLCSDFSR